MMRKMLVFHFYDGDELDCSKLVEELVVLNIPFSTLCSESCKGLCIKCGINLNNSKCNCLEERKLDKSDKDTHKPFEKLKDLKILN